MTQQTTPLTMPRFIERALADGPRTETMTATRTTWDGVTTTQTWTRTERVLPESYRGWWIVEAVAPDSPSASERANYHAYPSVEMAGDYLERHVYEGGIAAIHAAIDALMGVDVPTPTPTATESAARRTSAHIACPNCGNPTLPELLMSASLGTACPECYDELSQ